MIINTNNVKKKIAKWDSPLVCCHTRISLTDATTSPYLSKPESFEAETMNLNALLELDSKPFMFIEFIHLLQCVYLDDHYSIEALALHYCAPIVPPISLQSLT